MPLQEVKSDNARELTDIANILAKSHKILVITGAGISTSCGIPDFRSKEGLYSLLLEDAAASTPSSSQQSTPSTPSRKRKRSSDLEDTLPPSSQESMSSTSSRRTVPSSPTKLKGQDLFDARVWKDENATSIFYQFIASLRKRIRDEVMDTSQTHKFIRTLRDGGRLMRCYTQNIDGLERRESLITDLTVGKGNKRRFIRRVYESPRPQSISAGDDMDGGCEVVPLHGDLETLRCNLCHQVCDWGDKENEIFFNGYAPECRTCAAKNEQRQIEGKRAVSVGLLRPNIVLYHEAHPSDHLLAPLPPHDISQNPEVLIIMGTSLKVHGLQKLIREFAKSIHGRKQGKGRVVFVNRTKPAESIWHEFIDDWISMDCDDWVMDLKTRREDIWLRQGELNLSISKTSNSGPSRNRKRQKTDPVKDKGARTQKKERMVSVTVTKTPKSPHGAGNRSSTPLESVTTGIDQVLPTPPPSRENSKRKQSRVPSRSSPTKLASPWKDDSLLETITVYQEQEESPPYEKLKDVTSPFKRKPLQPKSSSAMNIANILTTNISPVRKRRAPERIPFADLLNI